MKKRIGLRVFLLLVPFVGFGVAVFLGTVRARWNHGDAGSRAGASTLSAKKSSPSPGGLTHPSGVVPPGEAQAPLPPPLLAQPGLLDPDSEGGRSRHELEQLTEAAKLTPRQQLRAASLIKDVQRSRTLIERIPDSERRRARREQLEKLERRALDAVINPDQAAAVDTYFAKRASGTQ